MFIFICLIGLLMAYGGCPGAGVIRVVSWGGLIAYAIWFIWDIFHPQRTSKTRSKPAYIPKKEPTQEQFMHSSNPRQAYYEAHAAWEDEQYRKMAATGEYRHDEKKFYEVLKRRNPHRNRTYSCCIICGEDNGKYTSEGYPRTGTTCRECDKQIGVQYRSEERHKSEAELAEEQRVFDIMPPRQIDGFKRQLQYIAEQRITRCLAISYDLMDGVISESWAADDMAAIKELADQERKRLLENERARILEQQTKESREHAERKKAQEIMRQHNM